MFKNDRFISEKYEAAKELIGRYIKSVDGAIGKISTVEPKYSTCEICVDFNDGIRVLDTRFTIEQWMEISLTQDQLKNQN